MDTYSSLASSPRVKASNLGFLSHDGVTQIKGVMLSPADKRATSPKAVIQILHGMEEYIGRYAAFATYLAEQGFVVCMADMIGHGRSVASPEKLSCMPIKNGKTVLIEDVHELRKTVSARFSRQTPYFIFGHSMGSLLLRVYMAQYGAGLAGVILSGTSQEPQFMTQFGTAYARMRAFFKGEDYKSATLENLVVGVFEKQIENPRTNLDWLSTDEAVVDAYIADPLCGIPFSAGAHGALTRLAGESARASTAVKVPKDLPAFFVAGALDPVGAKTVGVEKAAALLRNAGLQRVDTKYYDGMRHEILNEPGKKEVYTDILQWIDSVLDKA